MERRDRGSRKVESEEEEVGVRVTEEEKVDGDKVGGKGEESEGDSGTSSLSLVAEHIQRNITSCPLCTQNFVVPKVQVLAFSLELQPCVCFFHKWCFTVSVDP